MDLRKLIPKSLAILEAMDGAGTIDGIDWFPIDNAVREALCQAIPRQLGVIERRAGKRPSKRTIYNAQWKDKNPHKVAAHRAVDSAKRYSGKLAPLSCVRCGEPEKTEAHHPDYSRPLNVEWLCRGCHTKEHAA